MEAYYFRFCDVETGIPTGYYGLVIAEDKSSLFWELDQYGDPYSTELIPARKGSFCCKYKFDKHGEFKKHTELEIGEDMPLPEDKRWKRADWKDLENEGLYG